MVGNDSGADPFGSLIRYVPTGQCLRRTESSAWTGPGHLERIVGMYDGLACASQGPARRPGSGSNRPSSRWA